MASELRISVIQMNSGADRKANLGQAARLMEAAILVDRPALIFLPEYFDFYGGEQEGKLAKAEPLDASSTLEFLSSFARRHGVWIHAGSIIERVAGDPRVYNTSLIVDRAGELRATYRKIHLFDITAPDGTVYRESATVKAGDRLASYEVDGFRVGCSICFDVRFAEMFVALAKAQVDILAIPAAFAMNTGKDHWDVLLRARAIECQTYVAAAAQVGPNISNGQTRATYGNSLICDPWGLVISRASDGLGFTSGTVARAQIGRARSLVPMTRHAEFAGVADCA
jgi:nitrilase